MFSSKAVGKVLSLTGDIKIAGSDGSFRALAVDEPVYEGERFVSSDAVATLEVDYFAILEPSVYGGVFNIFIDKSLTEELSGNENVVEEIPFDIVSLLDDIGSIIDSSADKAELSEDAKLAMSDIDIEGLTDTDSGLIPKDSENSNVTIVNDTSVAVPIAIEDDIIVY